MPVSQQKLNVLFLASWYPNRVEPQNGNFIQRHATAVSLNCNVAVLHVLSVPGQVGFEVEINRQNGIMEIVVYFGKTPSWMPFKKYNRYLKAHKIGYERILQEFKTVDLVHLNVFFPAGVFALYLKNKFRIPFVITEHWTAFLEINPYRFSWYESYFIKKIGKAASMICPVSEDLKNAIDNYGIEGPFQVIPNVVDTQLFQAPDQRAHSKIKVLHVSTLYDQHKNVSGILNVLAKLHHKRDDFEVTFAGNKFGDLYTKKAKALGIPNHILTIKEEIPIEDIAKLMEAHHIFVLFSNYENLPCVISEAHAAGMVVIATDVGGVREMIEDKNGFLIQARDEAALLEKLEKALDTISTFQPKAIRQKAVERYSYLSVANAYLDVYKNVLDENNS